MGVTIPKDASLLGIPLLKVRNFLQNWHRNGATDSWSHLRRRGIEMEPATAAVLVDELYERGLIGDGTNAFGVELPDMLTDKGKALGSAKVVRRTSKTAAASVLEGLFVGADRINARPDMPFRVARIWLFGSMIDPNKADVGDIDFCAEFENTPSYADPDDWAKRCRELFHELRLPDSAYLFTYSSVRDRMLYGPRRHPLLAPNEVERMSMLGCRCRLAYDADRGGRVEDAPLERHPSSNGRHPSMPAPATMPDLSPRSEAISPVPIRLALPERLEFGRQFELRHPRGVAIGAAVGKAHQGRLPVILSRRPSVEVRKANGLPSALDLSRCDGQSVFAVLPERAIRPGDDPDERRPPGCGFVVGRSITREDGISVYRLGIDQYATIGRPATPEMLAMTHWVLHTCMQADVERIVRRSAEAGLSCDVRIVIDNACPEIETEDLVRDLRRDIPRVMSGVRQRTGEDTRLVRTPRPDVAAPTFSPRP